MQEITESQMFIFSQFASKKYTETEVINMAKKVFPKNDIASDVEFVKTNLRMVESSHKPQIPCKESF